MPSAGCRQPSNCSWLCSGHRQLTAAAAHCCWQNGVTLEAVTRRTLCTWYYQAACCMQKSLHFFNSPLECSPSTMIHHWTLQQFVTCELP
jgi:hypothetical protein